MQTDSQPVQSSLQRPKWLQKALAVSLIANVALACFSLVEWHETGYLILEKFHYTPQKTYIVSFDASGSLMESLVAMKQKPYEALIADLSDETMQFDGYRTRDLALAGLCQFHKFNAEKALSGALQIKERKKVKLGDGEVTLFPGLQPEQFLAVNRFVGEERYPFTTEGLFERLVDSSDEALKAACRSTPEYIALETLFKNDATHDELLALASGIGYKGLSEYFEGQKKLLDTTILKKREFLVKFLQAGNKQAAQFLVKIDRDYALHKLDDKDALTLLALLDNPSDYAVGLLKSNRKAEVLSRALACVQKQNPQLIASLAPKKEIKKGVQVAAKSKEVEKRTTKMATVKTAAAPRSRSYIVQNGDSLWRISKKFQVAISDIKRLNRLQSDDLKPGTTLSIPN